MPSGANYANVGYPINAHPPFGAAEQQRAIAIMRGALRGYPARAVDPVLVLLTASLRRRGGLASFTGKVRRLDLPLPAAMVSRFSTTVDQAFGLVLRQLRVLTASTAQVRGRKPAKRQVVEPTMRVPKDPAKLLAALQELNQKLQDETDAQILAILRMKLAAHQSVAKMLLAKPGVDENILVEIRRALGMGTGEAAPAAPSETKPEAPSETKPEATSEVKPDGKPEGETSAGGEEATSDADSDKGIWGWLWPTDKPMVKRPATWVAGALVVGGLLWTGTRTEKEE